MKRAVVLSQYLVLLNASTISWLVRAHILPIFTTSGLHNPRSLVYQRVLWSIGFSNTLSCYCFNMAANNRVGRAHEIYSFVMIQLIGNGSLIKPIIIFICNTFDVNVKSSFHMKTIEQLISPPTTSIKV